MVLISEGPIDSLHMEESNETNDQHVVSRTSSSSTTSRRSDMFMATNQHTHHNQLARLTRNTARYQSATALVTLPANSSTQLELVNRLNRCQLEDKLYQLKDENIHLKRESQAAEFQLKQLTSRLTRLIREKKRMITKEPSRNPREVDLEEIAFEFSEKICALEHENSRLRDRNTLLKVQLGEAERSSAEKWAHVKPRVDTGMAKRPPKNFRSNLNKKYASTTAINRIASGDYSALPAPRPPAPPQQGSKSSPTRSQRPKSGVQHGSTKSTLRRKVSFMSNENIYQLQDAQIDNRIKNGRRDSNSPCDALSPTVYSQHSQATASSSSSSSASGKRITSPPSSTSQTQQFPRKNHPQNIHCSNM